jgi:hypothetical protein
MIRAIPHLGLYIKSTPSPCCLLVFTVRECSNERHLHFVDEVFKTLLLEKILTLHQVSVIKFHTIFNIITKIYTDVSLLQKEFNVI